MTRKFKFLLYLNLVSALLDSWSLTSLAVYKALWDPLLEPENHPVRSVPMRQLQLRGANWLVQEHTVLVKTFFLFLNKGTI